MKGKDEEGLPRFDNPWHDVIGLLGCPCFGRWHRSLPTFILLTILRTHLLQSRKSRQIYNTTSPRITSHYQWKWKQIPIDAVKNRGKIIEVDADVDLLKPVSEHRRGTLSCDPQRFLSRHTKVDTYTSGNVHMESETVIVEGVSICFTLKRQYKVQRMLHHDIEGSSVFSNLLVV